MYSEVYIRREEAPFCREHGDVYIFALCYFAEGDGKLEVAVLIEGI